MSYIFYHRTRLWKTKHPRKFFQHFRQSCVLLTDRIEIHQLQSLVWPSNLLYVMLSGCDWWISIRSVNNTQDWQKFWKHFRGCFVFQSRVSTKTVVKCRSVLKKSQQHPRLKSFSTCGRRSGLMLVRRILDQEVQFTRAGVIRLLSEPINFHSASLHTGVQMVWFSFKGVIHHKRS